MLKSLMVSENSLAFSLSLIYLCLGLVLFINSLGIFRRLDTSFVCQSTVFMTFLLYSVQRSNFYMLSQLRTFVNNFLKVFKIFF